MQFKKIIFCADNVKHDKMCQKCSELSFFRSLKINLNCMSHSDPI